jgi:hypothetical protein
MEIIDGTWDEKKRGWLLGPFEPEELTAELGCWIPSRRFGLRQGGKVRAIDDFSESRVNDTRASAETVDPADLDAIGANLRAHMDVLTVADTDRATSSPFKGHVAHQDHAGAQVHGRLWDLSKAYRQLARRPADAALTVVCVWDPVSQQPLYFKQPSLAFGAAASVLGFNWVAAALATILVEIFHVGATNFYDDFTVFEGASLVDSCTLVVDALFDLLGWECKDLPGFSLHPEPLGAAISLQDFTRGRCTISNKVSRVRELAETIDQITASKHLPFDVLRSLRSRLTYCRAQCFGRFGAAALGALNSLREDSYPEDEVPAACLSALERLRRYLVTAPPRSLRAGFEAPILLTDGAVEFSTVHHTPHDWPGLSSSGGSTVVPSCLAVAGQLGRNDDGPGLSASCGSAAVLSPFTASLGACVLARGIGATSLSTCQPFHARRALGFYNCPSPGGHYHHGLLQLPIPIHN